MNTYDPKNSFKIFIDNKGYLVVIFTDSGTSENFTINQAELLRTKLLEILNKNVSKKYKVILDLLSTGNKIIYLPKEARDIYEEMAKLKQVIAVAVISPKNITSIALKTILITMMYSYNVDLFSNKKDAVRWLDEQ